MDQSILEEILACPALPTLPAVAVQVIDLTQDPDVSMPDLAATIQNDQALAAKILRTVNSSFYGLRQQCATIDKALILLGLSPVKSLALGFSLVSGLSGTEGDGFDYVAYWRRGLYSAVGAKAVANAAGLELEDEAFLGGLLQDVGVMAMHRALGKRYGDVLRAAGTHRRLVQCELDAFELQHSDVGASLAQRWRLPDELVMPVKYHERPTAAPPAYLELVQCVALGNIAHDVLTEEKSGPELTRFRARARDWFDLDEATVTELVETISNGSKELSSIFKLDTGPYANPEDVLRKAERQLIDVSREEAKDAEPEDGIEAIEASQQVDHVTGLGTLARFSDAAHNSFKRAQAEDEPATIVYLMVDGYEEALRSGGVGATEEVLIGTAALLKKHFDPLGAVICRCGNDRFGIVLSGVGRADAVNTASIFRDELRESSRRWKIEGIDTSLNVTSSIGTATAEGTDEGPFGRVQQLAGAATKAMEASRHAGGNCIRSFIPKAA